jgi:hypothetical protein
MPGAPAQARPAPGMPPRPGAVSPGARPAGPMPAAQGAFPPGARPGAPVPVRPPAAAAQQPRPAAPAAARPASAAAPRPAPAPAARRDPFGFGLGAPAPAAPAPAAPVENDWSDIDVGDAAAAGTPARRAPIELPPAVEEAPELAPMHAFVPPASATGHQAADGGEAALRDALSKASREVIERVVWEVVPELAETIIRENLDRLVKTRQG